MLDKIMTVICFLIVAPVAASAIVMGIQYEHTGEIAPMILAVTGIYFFYLCVMKIKKMVTK